MNWATDKERKVSTHLKFELGAGIAGDFEKQQIVIYLQSGKPGSNCCKFEIPKLKEGNNTPNEIGITPAASIAQEDETGTLKELAKGSDLAGSCSTGFIVVGTKGHCLRRTMVELLHIKAEFHEERNLFLEELRAEVPLILLREESLGLDRAEIRVGKHNFGKERT